ncbi:MAG TPA: NAD(P)-dependent oxidoreductase [Acidobacteriaceae bacterium]|jgi:nucleoside-diphosphate-sugar epimerase|nr:NAD(P)-dependent oxidoreductase [Acidobacteriaceae bacterium]
MSHRVTSHVLLTGGAGFFGGILKRRLLANRWRVTSIDRVPDLSWHPNLTKIQGDLRDPLLINQVFSGARFDAVFHCAAVLAHGLSLDEADLWSSNVQATSMLAEACRSHAVPRLVFTSTNCLWASNPGHAIREDETPAPVEIYGQSKLAAEQILERYAPWLDVVILRCPTIIDRGRLGLLAILFEFIHDGKTVWVVGDGSNRYQFIYAEDLVRACLAALEYNGSGVFHVGSGNVQPLRDVYQAVIDAAGSSSRVRSLPLRPTLAAMRLAHRLRLSPLGPYHYRMIAEDFLFDTTRIRERMGWQPTLTNAEMLVQAYRYYATRREEIHRRTEVSAHSKAAPMGVIRLLKWVS